MPCRFYLGTCEACWLERVPIPLLLSRRHLAGRRQLPRALAPWALDSGGFSELTLYGRWRVSAAQYVQEVRRFASEIGKLEWVAIQDFMCEPQILNKTGLSVREHQERTLYSYLQLRDLAPELPWLPIVQGWTVDNYLHHIDLYAKAGVTLSDLPLVGLGSVCRRQHTAEVEALIRRLCSEYRLRLHAFGVKTRGLERVGPCLTSADSMAWAMAARWSQALPGCSHKHCIHCQVYALLWRYTLLTKLQQAEARFLDDKLNS